LPFTLPPLRTCVLRGSRPSVVVTGWAVLLLVFILVGDRLSNALARGHERGTMAHRTLALSP